MNSNRPLPVNTLLDGGEYCYVIEKVIGQGSYGITYLARAVGKGRMLHNRQVAIKEFFPYDFSQREGSKVETICDDTRYIYHHKQFLQEAKFLQETRHNGIVAAYETFHENGTIYYSMEYIDGGSLSTYIASKNGMPEREALQYIRQVANALSFLHGEKIMHLDVNPANILRRTNGDVVLIDFGISSILRDTMEITGDLMPQRGGNIFYSPPEQFHPDFGNEFTPTADIYALGATLYKMLTNEHPPFNDTILNDEFPTSALKKRGISMETIELVSRAMEPIKRKRIKIIEEFLEMVDSILSLEKLTTASDSSIPQELPDQPANEDEDEISIRWKEGLSETRKEQINRLLLEMKIIGCTNVKLGQKTGKKYFKRRVIATKRCLRYYMENIFGYCYDFNSRYCHPLKPYFTFIQQLAEATSLPFRISTEKESYHSEHTLYDDNKEMQTLCYSDYYGFQSVIRGTTRCIKEVSPEFLNRNCYYDVLLVCSSTKPLYDDGIFYTTEQTQEPYDAICPIGFDMYRIKTNGLWNVVSDSKPSYRKLPMDYEEISGIDIHGIPGPGPTIYEFIGITAKREGVIYYYSFNNGNFKLLEKLTEKEIHEREMYT